MSAGTAAASPSLLDRRLLVWTLGALAAAAAGAMLWYKPWAGVAVMFAGCGLLAMAAWPNLATLAVLFLLYTNAPVVAVRFHGVPYAVGAAMPLLLGFPLAYYLIVRRREIVIDQAVPWILVFLIVQFASAVFSTDPALAVTQVIESFIEGFCLYFLIINVVRDPRLLRLVTWVLLLAGGMLGALSGLQQATKTYGNNYGGFAQMSNTEFRTGQADMHGEVLQRRLAGPLGDQNRYAQMMLMVLPLGFFRFWGERSRTLRIAAIGLSVLIAVGIMLTFSRGAAVAFVLLVAGMVLMRYISLLQCALVATAAAVLLVAAAPQYVARLVSLDALRSAIGSDGSQGIMAADSAIRSRYTEMMSALWMYADHPLLGVGPGMYPFYYRTYAEMVGGNVKETNRLPHSLYPGMAAELGTPGVVVHLLIVFVVLRGLVRARCRFRRVDPDLASMATGFLLAIVAYLAAGLFLHFTYVRYFWLILGLGGAASYIAGEKMGATNGNNEEAVPDPELV